VHKAELTDNSTDGLDPSHPPNGKKIVYTAGDGHDEDIRTINPGGGGKPQVTDTKPYASNPSRGSRQ
jgi:Tol biopolymer transport system component